MKSDTVRKALRKNILIDAKIVLNMDLGAFVSSATSPEPLQLAPDYHRRQQMPDSSIMSHKISLNCAF